MIILAHRGAHDHFPENTIEAFERAAVLGAQWIECDVQITADNVPVIFHDDNLQRLFGTYTQLSSLSYDELKAFAFQNGEQVPSLEQTLQWLSNQTLSMNLELKCADFIHPCQTLVDATLAVLKRFSDLSDRLLISSFHWAWLREFGLKAPHYPLMRLYKHNPKTDDWIEALIAIQNHIVNVQHLAINQTALDQLTIDLLKSHGYTIWSHTLKEQSHIDQFKAWGVDGVFVDGDALLSAT